MRKRLLMGMAAIGLMTAGGALADVRDGVDAWGRGDYRAAVEQWRPAANAGDADAQFNLGQAYTLGRGVPLDIPMAESWFRKAALQGHVEAQAKYGLVLFDQKKTAEALPWLEKAAQRGEPRAQLVLGTMLLNGDGVSKDWPRAYALLVRAAASGAPHASEVQAQMDRIIPTEQRQQGLVLARQYEAEAQRPQLPPEITGKPTPPTIRGTDLPPSAYDANAPRKPEIVAMTPPPPPPAPTQSKPAKPRAAPAPAPAKAAATASSPGKWRVQLGAFGDPNNARKLWSQVGNRFPGASVSYAKAGALTRVLVGPYPSRATAIAACGAVRPCVPVGD